MQVRSLEAANRKLELQIREYYEKRSPSLSRDFTKFFAIITDLRAQVLSAFYTTRHNNTVRLSRCSWFGVYCKKKNGYMTKLSGTINVLVLDPEEIHRESNYQPADGQCSAGCR